MRRSRSRRPSPPKSLARRAPSSGRFRRSARCPMTTHGRLVRRGRDLITATYAHIGPDGAGSREALCRQQSRLQQLPSRRRREEIRSADFRTGRDVSAYSARLGAEITHRGPREFVHDAQHERPHAAVGQSGDAAPWWPISSFCRRAFATGKVLSGLGAGTMPELDRAADPVRGRGHLRQCLPRLPQHRRLRRPPQPADHRSRLHGAAAVGRGQFQRWRRHGAADHRGEFRSLQHAGRRRIICIRSSRPKQAWDVAAYMISQPRPQQRGARQGFSRPFEQADRCALRPLCRRLLRRAAQIRAVRPDPREVAGDRRKRRAR